MNSAVDGAAERAKNIVDEISDRLAFESRADLSFTASLLNQLYTTEAIRDGLPHAHEEGGYSLPVQRLDKSPATLPEPAVAEHLIKVFFELSNSSVPMLHEPTSEIISVRCQTTIRHQTTTKRHSSPSSSTRLRF